MPQWGHLSSASGSDSGHGNHDSFAGVPLLDWLPLIPGLSYHLGQIWAKALPETMTALPGRQVEKLQKKHMVPLPKL